MASQPSRWGRVASVNVASNQRRTNGKNDGIDSLYAGDFLTTGRRESEEPPTDQQNEHGDRGDVSLRQCVPRPLRTSRRSAAVELFVSEDVEKPNVKPKVNCQSGTPLVNPRRTPASNHTFFADQGCQMTPRSAESRWSSRRGFSPFTSPTRRTPLATGSSPITPQIPTTSPVDRSIPAPPLRWNVKGPSLSLRMPMASNPNFRSPFSVAGKSGPASIAKPKPSLSWRTPSFSTPFRKIPGSMTFTSASGARRMANSATSSQSLNHP